MGALLVSQPLVPFTENNKWGYKKGNTVMISPEYDSAYAFNYGNLLAMVSTRSQFNKVTNPLTGEEEYEHDYFYINARNRKLKILPENFPDSVEAFPNQQELASDYMDSAAVFKVLFQDKVYLVSKSGKQLSQGFDNIYRSRFRDYYITENTTEVEKRLVRIKGLVNTQGKVIVKCKYAGLDINPEDSSVYCCSAVYNNKLNDDVYDLDGKLFYTNKNHIEFSAKTVHVCKTYLPHEMILVENSATKDQYELDGTGFFYLKKGKALLINKDSWYVIDLFTRKKQKVDREEYFFNLQKITE